MSLHTIVSNGVVARLLPRRAPAAVAQPMTTDLAVRLPGGSMWLLETGLALTSLATALLIGLGR